MTYSDGTIPDWKARALKAEDRVDELEHYRQEAFEALEITTERAEKAEAALREIATLQDKPGLEKPFRSVANEMADIARAALEKESK